jgi:hypothetical protein
LLLALHLSALVIAGIGIGFVICELSIIASAALKSLLVLA